MNVEIRKNGNILFRDGNKAYKFVNMGEYVGHMSRSWDEASPDYYKLMTYNETSEDGVLHIEALIDSIGDYTRLIVKKGDTERVVSLSGVTVLGDVVYVMGDGDDIFPKRKYVAYEGNLENRKTIQEYFQGKHYFKSKDGEEFTGEVVDDRYVIDFLSKGEELKSSITSDKEGKMRM